MMLYEKAKMEKKAGRWLVIAAGALLVALLMALGREEQERMMAVEQPQ